MTPLEEILEAAGIPQGKTRVLAERDGHKVVTAAPRSSPFGIWSIDDLPDAWSAVALIEEEASAEYRKRYIDALDRYDEMMSTGLSGHFTIPPFSFDDPGDEVAPEATA